MTSQIRAKVHPSNPFFTNRDDLTGYEIHMGKTSFQRKNYMFEIVRREGASVSVPDGFISKDGRVWGTYIHGIFDNDGFRREFVRRVKSEKGLPVASASVGEGEGEPRFNYEEFREAQYDALAALVREHIDMKAFYRIAGLK